jgi:dipeptide/tripeptide permease
MWHVLVLRACYFISSHLMEFLFSLGLGPCSVAVLSLRSGHVQYARCDCNKPHCLLGFKYILWTTSELMVCVVGSTKLGVSIT